MTYQNIKTTSVNITALPNKPLTGVVHEAILYSMDMGLTTTLDIDGKFYVINPGLLVQDVLNQHPPTEVPLVQNS